MLQEGPSPAQVIGAVARHVGQAPGRQMGRQVGACGPGLVGEEGGTQAPWGRGPAARREAGHQTLMPGEALAVPHPVLSPVKWSWQPAAGVGVAERQALGGGAHF